MPTGRHVATVVGEDDFRARLCNPGVNGKAGEGGAEDSDKIGRNLTGAAEVEDGVLAGGKRDRAADAVGTLEAEACLMVLWMLSCTERYTVKVA